MTSGCGDRDWSRSQFQLNVQCINFVHGSCFVLLHGRKDKGQSYPYPSRLLRWHWANHMNAQVPVKELWRTWVNHNANPLWTDKTTTTKQSRTKPCAYSVGCNVSPWNHYWTEMKCNFENSNSITACEEVMARKFCPLDTWGILGTGHMAQLSTANKSIHNSILLWFAVVMSMA